MRAKALDEADRAADEEEAARQEALWRSKRPARLQARKTCYNCGEQVQPDDLFCDIECRRDYERRGKVAEKKGERNG